MAEQARAQRARRRRSRRRRQVVAAGVGIVVVGAGTAVAIATTSDDGPDYRVAAVTRATLTQTISSSGTVASSSTLSLSFPTTGTVRSVKVKVGQSVKQGQEVATLDTTSLQSAIVSAQSTVASAEQRLEADKTGQTSAARTGGSSTGGVTTSSFGESPLTGTPNSPTSPAATPSPSARKQPDQQHSSPVSLSDLIKQVEQAQDAVIAAQKDVDTNQSAVDAAQKVVDTDVSDNAALATTLTQAESTACTPDPTTTTCQNARTAYAQSAVALAAQLATDTHTLDLAITAQDDAIKKLDASISALDKLVDQVQAAAAKKAESGAGGTRGGTAAPNRSKTSATQGNRPGSGTSAGGKYSGRPSGSASTGASKQSSAPQQTAQPASAAQLASDQAAIDAANAQLRVAKQNLDAATLKAPAAGKVAEVDMAAGSSSGGATITIVGTGIQDIDTSVPLGQVDTIKVGQSVAVAADGVQEKLRGTVMSIGILSSTSGSLTTFPVVVQLAAGSPRLFDGSGAQVVITTGSAQNVLTVPTSAVHTLGTARHTVTVLSNGRATAVPVTLGLAGEDRTQVVSGLKLGEQVELADLSQRLPSSTTSDTGSRLRAGFTGGRRFSGLTRSGGN